MNHFSDVQPKEQASKGMVHIVHSRSKKEVGVGVSEQTLAKQEIITRKLLDTMKDMVILVDKHGTIRWANNSAATILNTSIEELIGDSIWDAYPIQRAPHYKILFHKVTTLSRPSSFVEKVEDRWIETVIHPIKGDHGELEEVAFFARDVTAQIEAEEAFKRVSLQLITVQEDERRRVAQDLHDEIGQQMTALLLELRSVQKVVVMDHAEDEVQIHDAIQNLEEIMRGLRQVVYQLYPPSLHKAKLNEVLNSLCFLFSKSTGIHIDLSSQSNFPALSNAYEVTLYRFVQEGLANAARHGKADSVWVNLDATDEGINISLEDDGLGFDPKKSSPGLGLHGLQERFQILKGSLEVESAPGKGTKLFGYLPMETNQS